MLTIDLRSLLPSSADSAADLLSFMMGDLKGEIPHYKFYSLIISKLIEARSRYGAEIITSFSELKKSVSYDKKMDKKIKSSLYGLIFQYLFLVLFTWLYIINIHLTLEIHFNIFNFVYLFLWQTLGGIMTFCIYRVIKNKCFKHFNLYFFSLYTLRAYLTLSWPITKTIKESKVADLPINKSFGSLEAKISHLTILLKTTGSLNPVDMELLLEELKDMYELKLEEFQRKLMLLKFCSLSLFILPSFLTSVFSVIEL